VTVLEQAVPAATWLRHYERAWLGKDLLGELAAVGQHDIDGRRIFPTSLAAARAYVGGPSKGASRGRN
jgi:hypothetical protein